jgi:hypothetical protein
MKIILEFGEGEEHLADVAINSSEMHADLLSFSEWLRSKEKWGNHEEEAQRAVEDIRSALYKYLGKYIDE